MCFSAGASFTSGVVLSVIGGGTLRKVRKPSQVLFACISVFFAFQQFTEGVLWKTIGNVDYAGVQKAATYIFLVMAEVVWPVMIPCSILFDGRK